ncbi:MAG: B12-binding domain-containing radical SAM protein [Candidatus Methylomirabilis sp.]|nr:B12-binding domain-containing radical SAM protein [Deltaproteobacteria bacterium]
MRCALIMPSWQSNDCYPEKLAQSMELYWQPIGILSIAAVLQKAGHEVHFIDGSFITHREVIARVKALQPGFIGIHANTPLWPKAVNTVEDCRKAAPDAHIGVGGPMPMVWEEKCFDDSKSLDTVFLGEGEVAVVKVCEIVEKVGRVADFSDVRGLIFRHPADGELRKTGEAQLIQDLDAIPYPAYDLLDDFKKYKAIPGTYKQKPVGCMFTSRGCDFRCIYCFQYGPQKVRMRSFENIMGEIEWLVRDFGVKEIRFLDDNFTEDRERAFKLCGEIKRNFPKISWYVSARADDVDQELLNEMYRCGCWAMLFGVESGVDKTLRTMRKGEDSATIRRAVWMAKRAKLKVYAPFIFGSPGETYEDGLKTIEFALEIDPYYVNFHLITPYPGTQLYDMANDCGTMEVDWNNFTFEHAAFVPHTMTREQLIELRTLAFKKFYSRPKFIARRLWNARSVDDWKALLHGARGLFHLFADKNVLDPSTFKSALQDNP